MALPTFATASQFQRVQMLEEALETVLDRGPELSVEPVQNGEPMHLFVIANPFNDTRTAFDLNQIARELEALLP